MILIRISVRGSESSCMTNVLHDAVIGLELSALENDDENFVERKKILLENRLGDMQN